MTTGKILRTLSIFALPCILGRILQNVNTLVDSVIVGQFINSAALASVGATGSVVSLFTDTVIGLMSGFSVVAGKKYGEQNKNELKKVFSNSLILSIAVSFVITVFGPLFAKQILVLMQTPAEIIDDAAVYLRIIFMGISTTVLYNFLCEMLRAVGNSKEPLIFLFASSVIHIVLILIFSSILNAGIIGAALSTVLSQGIAVVMCVRFIMKKVPFFKISKEVPKFNKNIMKECLHIGIPMAVTNFVVSFGMIILSFISNTIGTEYVTAYSCASRIGYIITTPIFGFATAASVFASQNLGAGNIQRIKKGVRQVNILVTAINVALFVVTMLIMRPLLEFMIKDSPIAVDAGVTYLFVRCIAMFVLTFAAMYKNVLTGLGQPLFPTISGFLEIAVRYIVPIAFAKKLGFISIPLTDAAAWLMLTIFLMPAYIYEIRKLQAKQKHTVLKKTSSLSGKKEL